MILPKSSRFLPTPLEPLKVSGLLDGLGRLQHLDRLLVAAALFQILDGDFGLEHLVRLGAAFGADDARGHGPLDDQGVRPLLGERAAEVDVQRVEILAHGRFGLQAVAGQCPGQVVAGHVLLRVARDRDIVVIDEHLDVELLADREARGLGVVAFHLAAVGAQQHDRFAGVRHGDAIAECPEVAEAAGGEFDAGRQSFFRMAGQAAVELAVVQQPFRRHRAVQHAQQILRRDAMARLIVETSARWARRWQ